MKTLLLALLLLAGCGGDNYGPECPRCDGEGKVDWNGSGFKPFDGKVKCPVCKGSGKR